MEWKKEPVLRRVRIHNLDTLVAEYYLNEDKDDSVNVVGSFLIVSTDGQETLYSPMGFTRVDNVLLTD